MKIFMNINEIWTPAKGLPYGKIKKIKNPAILVEKGIIKEIEEEQTLLDKYPYVETVDCHQQNLLPGFVDPHTHPVFAKTREEEFIMRTQGKSYEEIAAAGGGIRNSVRAFREGSFEEIINLTIPRVQKFLEYGTTTIEAKSGYGLSLEDELKALRVIKKLQELIPISIVPTFLGAHEIPDEYRDNKSEYVKIICEEMIPRVAEENLAVFCDIFTEKNVFEIEESRIILETAKKYGLIPKMHADELYPLGGASLAAEVGAISADHLVLVSDKGIEDMKDGGVIPVLLPGTTFFLGKPQYAPARKMIEKELFPALATDYNPGSSFTQNMQIILSLSAIYLHMLPGEYLWASTLQAAKAIKMDHFVGSVEEGKFADFILTSAPNLEYLAYNYGINHIKKVYKKGILVHEN